MSRFLRVLGAVCVVIVLVGANAYADSFSFITSRTGVDTIDWGQFGAEYTQFSSPGAWTSNLGATGFVSDVSRTDPATLERRDQGSGWNGDFSPGDKLIWNQNNGNPIEVAFNTPISVGGAQIQFDPFGAFNGCIQAAGSFGLSDVYCTATNSTSAGDGSAAFVGIMDSTGANITSLFFTTNGTPNSPNQTAINQLSFTGGEAPVPEPASLLLFGSGLVGLIRRRWVV